jgi:hypothetical protein
MEELMSQHSGRRVNWNEGLRRVSLVGWSFVALLGMAASAVLASDVGVLAGMVCVAVAATIPWGSTE